MSEPDLATWLPPKPEDPIVSVVLPTRNGARFIAESIRSVLAQTFKGLELIVVLDGCTDDTAEIVKGIAECDDRIGILEYRRNIGLPKALNSGFARARGVYFTWTSDDNCYKCNAIKVLKSALETHEADIVLGGTETVTEEGELIGQITSRDLRKLCIGNVVGPCFLYRREVHETLGGYDAETFLAEDYDFFLRAYCFGFRFHVIPQVLYRYRFHGKSLTSTKGSEVTRVRDRVILKCLGILPDPDGTIRAETALALARRFKGRKEWLGVVRSVTLGLVHGPGATLRWLLEACWRRLYSYLRK